MNGLTSDQLFGSELLDRDGEKIGTVESVWVDDSTNQPEFAGVKTGMIFGHTHIVPVGDATMNDGSLSVPYSVQMVKDAPHFDSDAELSPDDESSIYSYYGDSRSTSQSPTGLEAGTGTTGRTGMTGTDDSTDSNTTAYAGDTRDQQVTLSEEQLNVGKQQVEAGRVRLRKVVETERQEVPVTLQQENVTIERVDATEADVPGDAFQNKEIEVPVMREEAVVSKETQVTGAVRVGKNVQQETRTVGADVRSEDVVVDEDVEDNAAVSNTTGYGTSNT